MHVLTLYSGIADTLTPEDIGNKILPGLIPMLITASFTTKQFNQLISTIRTLIDQLEKHRLKDLSEMDPYGDGDSSNKQSKQKDIFGGIYGDDPLAALPPQDNDGELDFLSQIEGTSNKQTPKSSGIDTMHSKAPVRDMFSDYGASSNVRIATSSTKGFEKNDMFKGLSGPPKNANIAKPVGSMSMGGTSGGAFDPFNTAGPSKPLGHPPKDPFANIDSFTSMGNDPFSSSKPTSSDPFSGFSGSTPVQKAMGISATSINMTSGFKSLKNNSDPFADVFNEEKKAPQNTGFGLNSGINFTSGAGSQRPRTQNTIPKNSDPFSDFNAGSISNPPMNNSSSSGFNYGAPSKPAPPTTSNTGGFNFGAPSQPPASSNLFGSSNTNSDPFNNFGSSLSGFPSNTGNLIFLKL
jgi:hypothetical protein